MRILIPHTRELCYFSGGFFLDRIQEELAWRGVEVVRLSEMGDDYTELEDVAASGEFSAIIDINSKLPRLIDDDGKYFLNSVDAPLYNYILDHPLYHHHGLAVKLANYHVVGIDDYHCRFMREWYPYLKSVSCIPMGGTAAVSAVPFAARRRDFLFLGTYISPRVLEERAFRVRSDFGEATYKLMRELYDAWEPNRTPIEEALHTLLSDYGGVYGGDVAMYINDVYEARDEAELLNRLYIVDQTKRNELRLAMLSEAADTGYDITIVGEGWDMTDLPGRKNVRLMEPVLMELSFELMANARFVIDSNPLFFRGMHDRVTSAFANGCVCITNMSREYDRGLVDGRDLFYYGDRGSSIAGVMSKVSGMPVDETAAVAMSGHRVWEDRYSWKTHVDRLLSALKMSHV